jgi:hypothetical protein
MSTIALLAAMDSEATTNAAYIAAGIGVIASTGVGVTTYWISRRSDHQQRMNADAVDRLRRDYRRSSGEVSAAESEIPVESGPERAQLEALNRRVNQRFDFQLKHYSDALQQNTTYFYLSLGVGIVGLLLIILAGIAAVLGVVGYATVGAIAGTLTEGAAGLIFNQSHKARTAAQENLKELASATEAAENRALSLVYSARVEDPQLRDQLNAQLALQALNLGGSNARLQLNLTGPTEREGNLA